MIAVQVRSATKKFKTPDGDVLVLEEVSFGVESGRFVSFFGPNGCGKSTLMNIISGVDFCDSGEVRVDNGGRGNLGVVFQDYRRSLLPWLSAQDNILFPIRLVGGDTVEARDRLLDLLGQLGVPLDLRSRVYNLSGGQAQLVSILRAIITGPKILLLDEPFSALDIRTVDSASKMLLDSWHKVESTVLFISHDLDDAIFLADETIVLSPRPAKILKRVPIMLERPRSVRLKTSKEFTELRLQILNVLLDCLESERNGAPDREAL